MARAGARAWGCWGFCAAHGFAAVARAQVEEGEVPPEPAREGEEGLAPTPVQGSVPGTALAVDPLLQDVAWSSQPVRWFGSAEFDTGFLYVRPRLSAGYGRPHDTWIGIDTNPIFSIEGVAGYAGLRFDVPFVNLRVGGRYWTTFRRSFLLPSDRYSVEDIELRGEPESRFLTWEAELTVSLPVGPGFMLLEGAGSYVTGVPEGYYVYEETLRVVVDPPWVFRGRVGYTVPLDPDRTIVFGPVFEVVHNPGRDTHVYRAGALARVTLSSALEARGTFVPAVATPDPLGARGGDAFLLGIRYRWATGP